MIQVLDGNGIEYDRALLPVVQRRALEAGAEVVGEVIYLPVKNGRRRYSFYGWESVTAFIGTLLTYARDLPGHLEILEGRRIGIPTLCRDDAIDLAVGIASDRPVSWRNRRV